MSALFKRAAILFYFLVTFNALLLGMFYAGATDAGANQGLAGGAIVLEYGVIFGLVSLFIAPFIVYNFRRRNIIILNKIMVLILVLALGIIFYRIFNSTNNTAFKNSNQSIILHSSVISKPALPLLQQNTPDMGLGMFAPSLSLERPLFFYGNPNLAKSIIEHTPYDSITFKRTEYGQFDIATAPPWLQPHHIKLDYDVMYFKVIGITQDFLEVIVNTTNQQTAYVDRRAGQLLYWPDFFNSMHSVEFINDQKVFARPFDYAGTVSTGFSFMRPVRIKQDWMEVILIDNAFEPVGKGWIKWHDHEKLLISYNLFS